ncbi:hypothetical protein J3E07_001620 [Methanococcus voltae]|uniref:Uncharacterized protein n=1 Tax=Methanococcus voltae TaxID=2188 RepID=A0A8J7UTY9_METVO|nr:hypothetical protein [Methanococcus voltae]MBP2202179.1 hypothetical protein [Methanococcus voltae]
MLKDTPNTRILSRYRIKIEENVLSIDSIKKAYVSINKITAVELDTTWAGIGIAIGIFIILGGIILNYILSNERAIIVGLVFGVIMILLGMCSYRVNIYTIGYKPITVQGPYGSMKKVYEELKKLV